MFRLSDEEWRCLRSQIVTLDIAGRGKYKKYLPFAFTEQGIAMLSGILSSAKAVDVNIAIMRAFVRIRRSMLNYNDLSSQIEDFQKITGKHTAQFSDVYEALAFLVAEKKKEKDWEDRNLIGFNRI